MSFSTDYFKHLCQNYPQLNSNNPELLESNLGENLISPLSIDLPSHILNQAQKMIQLLFKIRSNDTYISHYQNIIQTHGLKNPRNHSILMSYDFHYHENQLKLIEVNTNAAFLILGYEMYHFSKKPLPYSHFKIEDLLANIQNELRLQEKEIKFPKIGIVDTDPSHQKLYLEFLVYKNFFDTHGFPTEILDLKDIKKLKEDSSFDFIYNRSTDFYLEESDSQILKTHFLNETFCLSPNPYEYLLLADKSRITDWSNPDFLKLFPLNDVEKELLNKSIPKTFPLDSTTQKELWEQRKKFFFKPMNSYGSKSAYSGNGISSVKFQQLALENTLAQEFAPPGKQKFGDQEFKYDLRFYAYEDQVQMVMGRLYQGQLTNFKTPLGGWSCINITDT